MISPLNPKIVSVAGLSAGAAALSTEEQKHTENDPKCNALGWCCVPLVTESYGAWGKEAMDSFKMLASHPVLPSYRANRSQSCCLNCIAGSIDSSIVFLHNKNARCCRLRCQSLQRFPMSHTSYLPTPRYNALQNILFLLPYN